MAGLCARWMPRGWRTTLAAWTCCSAADWPRTPRTAAPSPGYSRRRRGAGDVTTPRPAARCVSTLGRWPTPVRRSAREQIEFADTLLLNKCDLVGPEEAARLERVLAALNPAARCVRCVRCEVPVQELLHSGRFRLDRAEEARPGIILFHPAIFCGTMLVAAWALGSDAVSAAVGHIPAVAVPGVVGGGQRLRPLCGRRGAARAPAGDGGVRDQHADLHRPPSVPSCPPLGGSPGGRRCPVAAPVQGMWSFLRYNNRRDLCSIASR